MTNLRLISKWSVLVVSAGVIWFVWQWLGSSPTEAKAEPPIPSYSKSLQVAEVIVDVTGKVRHPGLVKLPSGSRVNDAIEAAGGIRKGATAGINLARVLVDGEQLVVGERYEKQGGKLNLNRATATELEQLPGIGPVLAARIVDYRETHGPFQTTQALDEVSGVGEKLLADLVELVSVG